MNSMGSVRDLEVYKASAPEDDDEYGAPTKVGPMSHAAVAKLMRDAEEAARHPSSNSSGVRPAMAMGRAAPVGESSDGPAVIEHEEDEESYFEPTRLNERAAEIAAAAIRDKGIGDSFNAPESDSHVRRSAPPRTAVTQAANESKHGLSETETFPDPLAPRIHDEVSAALARAPVEPPAPEASRVQKGAAFPEWLGVTLHRDELEGEKQRQLVVQVAIAAGVFLVVTVALVWWLF